MKTVSLRRLRHRDMDCIGIFFEKDWEVKEIVRRIPELKFSITHFCWYMKDEPGVIDLIMNHLSSKVHVDLSTLDEKKSTTSNNSGDGSGTALVVSSSSRYRSIQEEALVAMEQRLKLRAYSPVTIRVYLEQFKFFMRFFKDHDPLDLGEPEIKNYLLYLVDIKKLSRSSQNQAINAIKFFYEQVMDNERKTYYLERPMKEKRLPMVLSQEEVMELFSVAGNIKHRLMLLIIYSAGLRRSELINLRISDLDLDRHVVFIRGGKGKKDRQSILAQSITPILKAYVEEYKPVFWLFEGEKRGKYSPSSLNKVFKAALHKSGITKAASLHTLRHSFATHLLEGGTSTRYIQTLLGHESPKTTEVYAHVTRFGLDKLRSPLDDLMRRKELDE